MHQFAKKLIVVGAAAGLTSVLGVAVAQVASYADPNAAPSDQQVQVTADHKNHIMYFADQGNSPETDPAAHLLLIKDPPAPQPVAVQETTTTTTTTVADATPPATDTSSSATTTSTEDRSAMAADTRSAPVEDNAPALPAKADRN